MPGERPVQVWNEFARVRLEVEEVGRARRLRVTDTATGRSILLDALELEGLTRVTHARLSALLRGDVPATGDGDVEGEEQPDA